MHLPGFTAESSIYTATGAYSQEGSHGNAKGGAVVTPQICACSPCLSIPIVGGRKICCCYPPLKCSIRRC